SQAAHINALDRQCMQQGIEEVLQVLENEKDEDVAELLTQLNSSLAIRVLTALPEERRSRLLACVAEESRDQWKVNESFPEGSLARLMEPPRAMVAPDVAVEEAREQLRAVVARALVSYAWVVDSERRLLGVLVFRDLFFADARTRVENIMIRKPFSLRPETP